MRNVTRGVVLGAIFVMVIAGFIPAASATAPFKETFVNQGIYTMEDLDCGTFWLTEQMVSEKVQVTHYYDSAGNETKSVTRADFLGTVTNSSSGHTFRDHAVFQETVDFVKGTTTVLGISYLFIVNGKVVFAEVGYKVLDTATGTVIKQIGPNDYEKYGLGKLCEVLL